MLDLMGALFFVDALMERGHERPPELILPFVPGARQDRLNPVGDYLFTAKSVAREINMRGFPMVHVLDPHSEVTPALIDRCNVIHAHEVFSDPGDYGHPPWRWTTAYSAIISPDSGAEKRAGAVAKKLGIPLIHGWKTRDVATGKITGFGLEQSSITGQVLVVDDICDGGGTFIGLAAVIKERGLKADLFVSHGLFSQGTSKLLEHYGRLFTTDSIETPLCDISSVEVILACNAILKGGVPARNPRAGHLT
jgi:ribose-phosphate pyrophosphokinase